MTFLKSIVSREGYDIYFFIPIKFQAATIQGPKEVVIKSSDTTATTSQPDAVARQPASNGDTSAEYSYETPDGRHRVYMRPKEDESDTSAHVNGTTEFVKTKSLAETKKQFEQNSIKIHNTSIADYGKRMHGDRKPVDDTLSDKYGISSDILSLLREEEKFWQKQQELKEWRSEKQPQQTLSRAQSNASERRKSASLQQVPKTEMELEEERMSREAKRLERLRVHQENLIKTFQDNLVRQEQNPTPEDNDHLPYQTPYPKPQQKQQQQQQQQHTTSSRTSYPPTATTDVTEQQESAHYDLNNTDIGHGILHQDTNRMTKNYNSDKRATHKNTKHNAKTYTEQPTYNTDTVKRRPSKTPSKSDATDATTSPSSPKDRAVCFSDDDEIFHESRRAPPGKTDARGYFSDPDMLTDSSAPRTFLARPLVRDTRGGGGHVRCTACCKPVSDEKLMHVEGQSYYWHTKCFYCVVCNAFLNDRHTIRIRITNYKLHCRFCYSSNTGEFFFVFLFLYFSVSKVIT